MPGSYRSLVGGVQEPCLETSNRLTVGNLENTAENLENPRLFRAGSVKPKSLYVHQIILEVVYLSLIQLLSHLKHINHYEARQILILIVQITPLYPPDVLGGNWLPPLVKGRAGVGSEIFRQEVYCRGEFTYI